MQREEEEEKEKEEKAAGMIAAGTFQSCVSLLAHTDRISRADPSGSLNGNSFNPRLRFDSNALFLRFLLNGIDQQGSILFDREGNSDLRCAFRGDREIFPDNPITNLLLPFGAGHRFLPEA